MSQDFLLTEWNTKITLLTGDAAHNLHRIAALRAHLAARPSLTGDALRSWEAEASVLAKTAQAALKVAQETFENFLDDKVLRQVAGHETPGAEIVEDFFERAMRRLRETVRETWTKVP